MIIDCAVGTSPPQASKCLRMMGSWCYFFQEELPFHNASTLLTGQWFLTWSQGDLHNCTLLPSGGNKQDVRVLMIKPAAVTAGKNCLSKNPQTMRNSFSCWCLSASSFDLALFCLATGFVFESVCLSLAWEVVILQGQKAMELWGLS